MTVKVGRGRQMRRISSAKRRRGQKESSIIQSDVPKSSIEKDMHFERTGRNGSWEISKKNLLPPH